MNWKKLLEEMKRRLLERINPHNPVPVPKPVKPKEEEK